MKMIKKILIGFAFFTVVAAVVFSMHGSASAYKVKIIKVDEGWGYEIKLAGETYIHQPFIPSIPRTIPFRTKKAAKKTALLVVKKLENGKLPSLTIEEIENLGIFIEER